MPWQFANVLMHGEVTPCCNSPRIMGNLTKQPIDRIWNGWRYRVFRFFVDSSIPPPECRTCHVYEGINQGNPGNTIAAEGLLLKHLYRLFRSLSERWHRRKQVTTPPAPNFFRGKPIKLTPPPTHSEQLDRA
jgi:sulfatase maturation enzyme AslB (radical SAM superfamily)